MFSRCAPLDVDQFQPVTAAETRAGLEETVAEGEDEVSAVVELNDETGAFEYSLYSLADPPYIKLYVPGTTTFPVNSNITRTVLSPGNRAKPCKFRYVSQWGTSYERQ